jgi:hypothetical protein
MDADRHLRFEINRAETSRVMLETDPDRRPDDWLALQQTLWFQAKEDAADARRRLAEITG